MDHLTPKDRSKNMSRIRGKDTRPELVVRKLVHAQGFRYRLHDKTLPGKPDLVFKGKRKVVFVHGCFWHQHANCKDATLPKSNEQFWMSKLQRNVERDAERLEQLRSLGWKSMTVWECETTTHLHELSDRLCAFLSEPA